MNSCTIDSLFHFNSLSLSYFLDDSIANDELYAIDKPSKVPYNSFPLIISRNNKKYIPSFHSEQLKYFLTEFTSFTTVITMATCAGYRVGEIFL